MRDFLLLEMMGIAIIGVSELPLRYVYAPDAGCLLVDSELLMSDVFAVTAEVLPVVAASASPQTHQPPG